MTRFEQSFRLVLEYSEKTIKELIDHYRKDGIDLDDQALRYYINRFDQVKQSTRFTDYVSNTFPDIRDPKDIKQFTFNQVEQAVDQFRPTNEKKAAIAPTDSQLEKSQDLELLYNQNGLEIFRANNEQGCIKINSGVAPLKDYSFCISRTSGNMYSNYRMRGKTFYFVIDKQKPTTDRYHLIVIHAHPESQTFGLSNAENYGDINVTWDEILEVQPKLSGLEEIFKFTPFTQEEQRKMVAEKTLTHEQFSALSYENKKDYIQYNGEITFRTFEILPDDLKELWVNTTDDVFVTDWRISKSKVTQIKQLKDRYPKYFKRLSDRVHRAEIETDAGVMFLTDEEIKQLRHEYVDHVRDGLDTNMYTALVDYTNPTEAVKLLSLIPKSYDVEKPIEMVSQAKKLNLQDEYGTAVYNYIVTHDHDINAYNHHSIQSYVYIFWELLSFEQQVDLFSNYGVGAAYFGSMGTFNNYPKREDPTDLHGVSPLQQWIKSEVTPEVMNDVIDQVAKVEDQAHGGFQPYEQIIAGYLDGDIPAESGPYLFETIIRPHATIVNDRFEHKQENQRNNYFIGNTDMSFVAWVERKKHSTVFMRYRGDNVFEEIPSKTKNKLLANINDLNEKQYLTTSMILDLSTISFNKREVKTKNEGLLSKDSPIYKQYEEQLKLLKEIRSTKGEGEFYSMTADVTDRVTVRVGRNRPIDNKHAFVFPYELHAHLLSTPTISNIETIALKYGIRFTTIYIVPVNGRDAWSFYVEGVYKGKPVVYARKEYPSMAAGQTIVYFDDRIVKATALILGPAPKQ